MLKVGICTVGIGGWYPRGVARMIERFHAVSPGFDIAAWVNCVPQNTPPLIVNGYDYTPYAAKVQALRTIAASGKYDVAILLDAAFYPIRHIQPLVDHICGTGYFFCKNGNKVGEWCSDESMHMMRRDREELMAMEEISSYCVGLDLRREHSASLVQAWVDSIPTFPGPHTAGKTGRNPGFVSTDPRVKGHRHDQTALSIIAHDMGLTKLVERPKFTAYLGSETEETVLVNHGGF